MKSRLLASILVSLMLVSPAATTVFAQSNHSLEWGVDIGEEFTYVLQRAFYADTNSKAFIEAQLPFLAQMQAGQKVFLEVNYLDIIESVINESSQLPRSYCSLLRINDSAVIMSDLTSLVIPIGDWDFFDEIENITGTQGQTLIDNADEWGFTASGLITNPGATDISVHIEMRYEKENGTLSYLRRRYSALGNDIIDVIFVHWYPGMPTIVGGGIQTTTLLMIAVGSIMSSIIAFIVYRGIKGKKSVAQRLGE